MAKGCCRRPWTFAAEDTLKSPAVNSSRPKARPGTASASSLRSTIAGGYFRRIERTRRLAPGGIHAQCMTCPPASQPLCYRLMSLLESIVKELSELPPPKLVAVSKYIHTLHVSPEAGER